MSSLVRLPQVSANEDTATLVAWHKEDRSAIRVGEPICTVETTKATVLVEADSDGYLVRLAAAGDRVSVGQPIAALTDAVDGDPRELLAKEPAQTRASGPRWTKKAALVAKRLGMDLERLAESYPGKLIGEADVLAAQSEKETVRDLLEDRFPVGKQERIVLLGGGAGAGVITLDAVSRSRHQRVVGILDGNPRTHGKTVMGVPVLGSLDRAEELYRSGMCDAVIILFTDHTEEREQLFRVLSDKGVRFTNVIDPAASVRAHVTMGTGNLIMANAFLGACATIGDNNFFASHTCIEHHATIGSHCTFGPRATTAGAVVVGDRVKIGMMVAIEPYVEIGSGSIVASGCVVTANVPAASVVRAHVGHTVSTRQTDEAS